MINKRLEKILKEWKNESEASGPIQYKYSYSTHILEIYTQYPGYYIGRAGQLSDKYKEKIKAEIPGFQNVDFKQVDSYIIDDEKYNNSNIADTNQSYTGEFIKNWCKQQINSKDEYIKVIAEDIIRNYFSESTSFKPNPTVYYSVWTNKDPRGNAFILVRDHKKSPKYNLKQKMRVVNMINLDYSNLQYYSVNSIEDAVRLIHQLAHIQLRNEAITDNSLDLEIYNITAKEWDIWEDEEGYNIDSYEWINGKVIRKE